MSVTPLPVTEHPALRNLPTAEPGAPEAVADRLLELAGPDAARLVGQLLAGGRRAAEATLAGVLKRPVTETAAVVDCLLTRTPLLTGAEAVAVILAQSGTRTVFGYPGTSELSLCDAVDRTQGVAMVNGRGDKESAFMAGGGSFLAPGRAAAILHGARGLTNGAGAVADVRRNEAGTVFLVGLPSSGSARFLPPHGEDNLLAAIGEFTSWWWQAPAVPAGDAAGAAAVAFVARLREACRVVRQAPYRPALFGIPQDVAEQRWIPAEALAEAPTPPAPGLPETEVVAAATGLLATAERPVILVDDYALRHDGVREGLDRVSRALGAAVLQVRYRRGPMLFERLRSEEVHGFAGWLNPYSPAHLELLDRCDLLVTVEDRNIYPRVVGPLPECRKIALNTDPAKVEKNEYMAPDDLLVPGDPGAALLGIASRLEQRGTAREQWFGPEVAATAMHTPEPAREPVVAARQRIVDAVAGLLSCWRNPVLVDDSQMFGGLLSEGYDGFPPGLRVFGGHGGFVGGGIPLATGVAIANPDADVLCTLGDQAFTNSFQGLVAAVQERPRITYLVCNNGRSVSLTKQSAASGPEWFGEGTRPFLHNVDDFDYCALASSFGIPAAAVEVPVGGDPAAVEEAVERLSAELDKAAAVDGPALIELRLPSDPDAWRGIWVTQGFETQRKVEA
ncbi:thiamine pyrophosphate-dependent enzyme [Streptomyces sp. NPDC090442]|uniref:thiamine pyrophosphate-dependent enzyme n=1 Tax=Streptomyces sp. NPDC090442 TaxID=3365962 RepID=UPI003824FCF9